MMIVVVVLEFGDGCSVVAVLWVLAVTVMLVKSDGKDGNRGRRKDNGRDKGVRR